MGTAVVESDSTTSGTDSSLQPISVQLKQYKPRDLAGSHQVRTRCKIFPPNSLVRKTVIGATDGGGRNVNFADVEFPSYYRSPADASDEHQTHGETLDSFGVAGKIYYYHYLIGSLNSRTIYLVRATFEFAY